MRTSGLRCLARLLPRRIAVQITLVMVLAVISIAVLTFLLLRLMHEGPPHEDYVRNNLAYGLVLGTLNAGDPAARAAYLEGMRTPEGVSGFRLVEAGELQALFDERRDPGGQGEFAGPRPRGAGPLRDGVVLLGDRFLPDASGEGGHREFFFRLSDGTGVAITEAQRERLPLLLTPLFQMLVSLAVSVLLLLVWVALTLTRPLSELAASAALYGQAPTRPVPIVERGPSEVRKVAHAFNLMQERIQDMIARRTRMLAAIGHDLRTPLTRLRLRLALMDEGEMKQRSLADLDLMEIQINGALSYLRAGDTGEAPDLIDLGSFLRGITDQYEDLDQQVPLTCAGGLSLRGRPVELNRALCNLIDNALRYAGAAEIRAGTAEGAVVIDVIDHGPGIDPDARARLLEPFERGDEARTYGKGVGFGLGLSISLSIAEAHGGHLELLDTPGGGLTARMVLPMDGLAA
ncbi:ATP-binding protein [Roseibium aestuarii]|uniref:histidine kinase n=1 Tax=Roseibium aestuarii TaxID=2600299 RepID=A0ABW4K0J9_9HYPH|nr:ATP-binding protein [Roseibium aestuarii]